MWQVAEREGGGKGVSCLKEYKLPSVGLDFFTLLKITTLFRCLKIERLPKEL